ncbi:lipid-A-disaccharide synthase [Leptolyngbya sp. AN02str]|uniref:lipid-A-disaccharide synthase n=1 Tax=Leptolyngbya sp. AN02str TaxID=3423363 RepID=UPI003D30F49E
MAIDILILSNGPGEITTWVRPVVQELRRQLGHDRSQVRISLILSPCPNASGKEVAVARRYPEIDRIQGAQHFYSFLLFGKTEENWAWRDRGVVLFLGGDQIYPVIIGKRLGYSTVIYAEWEARWHRWVNRFAVMHPTVAERAKPRYAHKFTVVGDLMGEIDDAQQLAPAVGSSTTSSRSPIIGFLPGSKSAKLSQGMPLITAIANYIHAHRPQIRFVIPVAPTLEPETLAQFANPEHNAIARYFGNPSARLVTTQTGPQLKTSNGAQFELYTQFPAYDLLSQCTLCITTVGANTAELGALAVPMLVLIPTQQLDAMRAWDGIPGLLANLPGIGSVLAWAINSWFLRSSRLLAWPNIWAGRKIVPELIGKLDPQEVAQQALDLLDDPTALATMRESMRQARGTRGAAQKIVHILMEELHLHPSA